MKKTILVLLFVVLLSASGEAQDGLPRKLIRQMAFTGRALQQRKTDLARPVQRTGDPQRDTKAITFHSFEFQQIYFGREGPNYIRIKGEPSQGAQQLAKAELFGHEAIATVRFEMLNQAGKLIQRLRLTKTSYRLSDGQYEGLINVPVQPFRVVVSGQDIHGRTFRRVHTHLFQPAEHPPAPPLVPEGFPEEYKQKIKQILETEDEKTKARFQAEDLGQPDGFLVMPRIEVSNVTYEPFLSQNGNPLGIRLKYEVSFSQHGTYSPSPLVFPAYENFDLRGAVEMKVINESVQPMPEVQHSQNRSDLLKYDIPAKYRGDVVYHFVADMIPGYVIQNAAKAKYCIYSRKFETSPKARSVWDTIQASELPIKYGVDIRNTRFYGQTENYYPQRTFYLNFVEEGAQDCGPNPNINF